MDQRQPVKKEKRSWNQQVQYARARDILDVANELGMELVPSGRDYRWKDHDSMVLSPDTNLWKWFRENKGGDVISLVETISDVDFNQAIHFLNEGSFKEFTAIERVEEPFHYYLKPYEQPFKEARDYLRNQRGLSDETIDFFYSQGVLAQANAKLNGSIEPVLVFKSLDANGEVIGANLQGIYEDREKWPDRGYAKRILRNSDGMTGLHIDIGQPKKLIFGESPIDLMSYYELHKEELKDVRLVSMDGLKESVIGNHLTILQSETSGRPIRWSREEIAKSLDVAIDRGYFSDGKNQDLITLAVDNDEAGRNFLRSLREKGAVITEDLPELQAGKEKSDWNDILKDSSVDNSRLGQARRKLDRLNSEFSDATNAAFSHSAEVNGQPMNDKRGGAAYFKRQEQLEEKIFGKLDEIKRQEERIEKLEQQQAFKENGLNRRGTGLEMSVQNIPRIREELEKAERGESFYTSATLKRYRQELVRLEKIADQVSTTTIQPGTQALIDDGLVTQWAKKPNLYFVKGLRKVAVELTNEGTFKASEKYRPKSKEDQEKLEELLAKQNVVVEDVAGDRELLEVSDLQQEQRLLDEITADETYYLWHEMELIDLGASQEIIEEFHLGLDSISYSKNGINLHVEESANEGASGYLSLEGHSLDLEGIGSYMSDYEIESADRIVFLENLKAAIQETWDSVVNQYDAALEDFIQRNNLKKEQKEKTHETTQESLNSNAGDSHRNPDYLGDSSPRTASKPVGNEFQPDFPVITPLNFTTKGEYMSTIKKGYHVISPAELSRLNKFAPGLQATAQWYLEELSNSKITYLYKDGDQIGKLDLSFSDDNFAHLTGILPKNVEMKQIVHDFANGNGDYGNIQVSHAIKDKSMVFPLLQDILSSSAFVFNDLSEVDKFHRINLSQAVMTEDKDLLLAIRDVDGIGVPASIMRIKEKLSLELTGEEKVILGIYRQRNNKIEQISINQDYIRDDGQELLSLIRNNTEIDDNKVVSQTDNQNLNEHVVDNLLEKTTELQEASEITGGEKIFTSPRTEVRNNLAKRVEEILSNDKEKSLLVETDSYQENSNSPESPTVDNSFSTDVESFSYEHASPYEISQHAFELIRQYSQSPEELKEYVSFMSKFPELSPRNVALIHEQWRGANAVATYRQWQSLGKELGIKPEDVIQTKASYTNKKTGETKEIFHQNLSVKAGEKSRITLFRLLTVNMIPVFDENGYHMKNEKGNPKYKRLSEATPQEKSLVKAGKLPVKQFPERDPKTGGPKFTTYKVFELSQTTLKPESYPKAMPNRHFNFNLDQVKTNEVLKGLSDYAKGIGIGITMDDAGFLGNAKGAFLPNEQSILLNPTNTPGEKIATTIHELAHATLHNPQLTELYKENVPTFQKELEAEMTSYLVANYFGLDTSEKAVPYIANWTEKLGKLNDKQLADSLGRIHKTVVRIHKHVSQHMSRQPRQDLNQNQNLSYQIGKGPKR